MSPTEHFYRAARYGFIAFLAAGTLVAVVFFTRGPDGQVHLVAWASLLREAGISAGVAHFLLWSVADGLHGLLRGRHGVGVLSLCPGAVPPLRGRGLLADGGQLGLPLP